MSYTIRDIRFLESAKGNKYARAIFDDGKEVAIFDKFPNFASLKAGDLVDGDLTRKEYNGKESFTLNEFKKPSSFTPKASGALAAAKETTKAVERAQDRKEDGIRMSATFRDATLLTVAWTAKQPDVSTSDIQLKWQEFRKWLDKEYNDPGIPFE